MPKLYIEESTLTNIGDAIRSKTGKTELIPTLNMSTEIRSISSGGGRAGYTVSGVTSGLENLLNSGGTLYGITEDGGYGTGTSGYYSFSNANQAINFLKYGRGQGYEKWICVYIELNFSGSTMSGTDYGQGSILLNQKYGNKTGCWLITDNNAILGAITAD